MAASREPSMHACEGADRVTNGNEHTSIRIAKSEIATFAHITVSAHERALLTKHHVKYAYGVIVERVTTTFPIDEPGLHHVILHVDGEEECLTLANNLFPLEDTCGRSLNDDPVVDRRLHCSVRVAVAAAAVPAIAAAVALLGRCSTMWGMFSLHCLVALLFFLFFTISLPLPLLQAWKTTQNGCKVRCAQG